jgi:hypothetical protein
MSLLLAGPSSITPWIEDAVFQALVHGPAAEPQRPRLAQVLAMRRYGPETTTTPTNNNGCCTTCPSFLVVHDGKTSVVCFLNKPISPSKHAGLPTKGCIVRISNWKVSLVESCAAGWPHGQHLQAHRPPDAVSYYLDVVKQSPRLCLDVASVEALGAHGIGIVGNPIHVHQSVDVRRALLSLNSKHKSLAQQLKLVSSPLGNVQQLFRSSGGAKSTVIQSLIAMAKEHDRKPAASTTTSPSGVVVLGNVQDLLDQSSKHNQKDNSFNRLVSLAKKQPLVVVQQQSRPRTGAAPAANPQKHGKIATRGSCVLGDVKALLSGNTQGGVTVNDVLQLARQMDSTTTPSSSEAPLASGGVVVMEPYEISANVVSRKSMVSLSGMQSILNHASEHDETQQAGGVVTEESPLQEEQGQRMEPYKITNALVVVPRKNMVSLSGKIPSMNMEPYKIRENVARHDSTVSVSSGTIQSALTFALLGRTSLISDVDTRETEQRPPALENVAMETTKDATNEDDNDSDNSSDIAGISDMLISQTSQDEDTSEQMQSKKRALGAATTTNKVSSVDDAPPQKKTKAAPAKRRSMSLLQHVMSQARKGSRKTSTALQKQGPAKTKHNGMLSSWLAQRVRPKGR